MGNEKKEEAVEVMEDILGLNEEAVVSDVDEVKESKDDVTPNEETKESKDDATPKTQTTVVTPEQITINQDMAKIDMQIEALEKESVDVGLFYDKIEEHLSEEEQALEFDDKPAYMKLVANKAKEYEETHSKSAEITKLKEEKAELEGIYERQSAIVEVSSQYPEYDHEKVLEFYENDLSKSEQNKILQDSSSYKEVYENAYKKYLEGNPANIAQSTPPNIPDVNSTRKVPANNSEIDDGLTSEDDRLKEALGL